MIIYVHACGAKAPIGIVAGSKPQISDVVILPGLRSLDDVAGTEAPPDISKIAGSILLFLFTLIHS
jgi:hypothetical protein